MSVHLFNHNIVELDVELKEVYKNDKRFYSTPAGDFPSVTTVVGFEKQQFFAEWRNRNPEESKRVTSRGTKFHSLIETYLNNENQTYRSIDLEITFKNPFQDL